MVLTNSNVTLSGTLPYRITGTFSRTIATFSNDGVADHSTLALPTNITVTNSNIISLGNISTPSFGCYLEIILSANSNNIILKGNLPIINPEYRTGTAFTLTFKHKNYWSNGVTYTLVSYNPGETYSSSITVSNTTTSVLSYSITPSSSGVREYILYSPGNSIIHGSRIINVLSSDPSTTIAFA